MRKKGLSTVVGYILMVSIIVAMSLIMYQWMKSYIPKPVLECPAEVSLIIEEAECNADQTLTVTVKNSGLFNIDGYIIRGELVSLVEEGLVDLYPDGYYMFGALKPGDPNTGIFGNTTGTDNKINSIEIVPVRLQNNSEGKEVIVVCGDGTVEKEIVCTVKMT